MNKIIIEIRSGEGGKESKMLVNDQYSIYVKACGLECL